MPPISRVRTAPTPAAGAARRFLPVLMLALFAGSVRAEVTYTPIDLTPIANGRLQNLKNADPDALYPTGPLDRGGVPFVIPDVPKNYWDSDLEGAFGVHSVDVPVGVAGVREAYALINTKWGQRGPQVYTTLEFFGSSGGYFRKDLLGDEDIRDTKFGPWMNRVNLTTSVPVWVGPVGNFHLDRVGVVLPKEFANQTLTKVRMTDQGQYFVHRAFLSGLTVATGTPAPAPALDYLPVDLSAFFTNPLKDLDPNFPKGEQVLGGIPFFIPNTANDYWFGDNSVQKVIDLPVGVPDVREADFLLNSWWGQPGPQSLASLEFFGTNNAYYKKDLIGNEDLREWVADSRFTLNINGTTTVPAVDPGTQHWLDRVKVALPEAFAGQTLTSIRVTDNGQHEVQRLMLAGVSVGVPAGNHALSLAVPDRVANTQPAAITLWGAGLGADTAVRLTRPGQEDLAPTSAWADASGRRMTLVFDLTGKAPGVWKLRATFPDGTSAVLPGPITFITDGKPQLVMGFLGYPNVRAGRPLRFLLTVANRGSADAIGELVRVSVPDFIQMEARDALSSPPAVEGQPALDYPKVSAVSVVGGKNLLLLYVPVIPAGSTLIYPVYLTGSDLEEHTHEGFQVVYHATDPAFSPRLDPDAEVFYDLLVGRTLEALGVAADPDKVTEGVGAALGAINAAYLNAQAAGQTPPLAFAATVASAVSETLAKLGRTLPEDQVRSATAAAVDAEYASYAGSGPEPLGAGPLQSSGGGGWSFPNPWSGFNSMNNSTSHDPNDKAGPAGAGEQRYLTGREPLRYLIRFENQPTASAAAQDVVVTDPLDPQTMDLDTLELGPITFGSHTLTPPPGLSEWTTDVDLRPGMNLILRVEAKLDRGNNALTWKFASLDPATMQPTENPLLGFLPPDRNPPEGEGSVFFTVDPKPGLATGTVIRNKASIVFDVNAPIDTPEWTNTVDNLLPESHVEPLAPAQPTSDIRVKWAGTDQGAGVKGYTVSVSEDGGPFTPWLSGTALTSATYPGAPGKTYRFKSAAVDAADNEEPEHLVADATTTAGSLSLGDADLNGVVDIRDAILVLRGLVGLEVLTPNQAAAADIVPDGAIDVLDAVGILRKIVGLP